MESNSGSDQEEATVDDVIERQFDVNSQAKYVKSKNKQPEYTKREMVVVWHYFENRYEDLYGEGKEAT